MNRTLFGAAWISALGHLQARDDKVETALLLAQVGDLQGG